MIFDFTSLAHMPLLLLILIFLLMNKKKKKRSGQGEINQGTEKSFPKTGVSLMAVSHLAGILNNRILKGESWDQAPLSLRLRFPLEAGPFERSSTVPKTG